MKKRSILITVLQHLIVFTMCIGTCAAFEAGEMDAAYGEGAAFIKVATGSPGSLGLLKALAEPFCRTNQCTVLWKKMGSGKSIKAMREGKVDMILVHAPEAEKKAMAEGWASLRSLLGSNEFYVLGPEADPAGIKNAQTAAQAYAMIARSRAEFFSRGDDSGTHKKEMMIWSATAITPEGPWYMVTHDFMGPTLMRADRERGYFMVDSSTFAAYSPRIKNLKVLFKGDPVLVNVYHALVTSPEKYPLANHWLAVKFVEFMCSSEGQKIFSEYGKAKFGMPLYTNAEYAREYELPANETQSVPLKSGAP